MSEWKEYKISNIGKVVTGKTPRTSISDNYGSTIPFLSPSDDMESKYVPTTARCLTEKGLSEVKNCLIPKNSICVSCIGSDMGKSVITDRPIVTNQQINSIIPSESFDPHFVYYLMQGKRREIRFIGRNGTAVPILNKSAFSNLTITAPDIDEQHRISSFLSALDDKIAVNRRICENLEAQAQALFKHWFIDFAPFKNGKFVESELGMIPEGWRVGTLEELCSFISRGLSPKYQLGTNELVLGQTCVRNNIVTLNNAREHQPKENCNKYVKKWDVLLNSTGIGSLGRVGVVYFDMTNVCFDSHLTVVRTKEDIYRYYVGRNLLNRQKELENMAVGSTGQTELPKKDVLVMPILIPNSDVLLEFNNIIENIGKIYTLIEENLRLSTLRDTLLPKLMSGQIKV